MRSGTNAESFLVEGADVDRQASLWVKYRLKRTEKCQLSLGWDWSYCQDHLFHASGLSRSTLPTGEAWKMLPSSSTPRSGPHGSLETGPALFHRLSAMRINAEFGLYEVPDTSGVSKGSHRVGILGEYGSQAYRRVPCRWASPWAIPRICPDDDPFTGLSGALLRGSGTRAKRDFVVGAETGFMKMPVDNQDHRQGGRHVRDLHHQVLLLGTGK